MPLTGQAKRDHDRKRYREWHQIVLDRLGGACVVCGSTNGLDAHHKNPDEKVDNVTRLYSHKEEVREAELAKCELRCHEHHKAMHATELRHGRTGYRRGCRCSECTKEQRLYQRQWRSRNNARAPQGSSQLS